MKNFELRSLLQTILTDINYYNAEMLKYDHFMMKQVQYGVEISNADTEARARVLKVIKALGELKNQINESIKE
jgi:hypothetical protein